MLNLIKKRKIPMPENCHTNLAKPGVFFLKKTNKQTLGSVLRAYFCRFQVMEIGV